METLIEEIELQLWRNVSMSLENFNNYFKLISHYRSIRSLTHGTQPERKNTLLLVKGF